MKIKVSGFVCDNLNAWTVTFSCNIWRPWQDVVFPFVAGFVSPLLWPVLSCSFLGGILTGVKGERCLKVCGSDRSRLCLGQRGIIPRVAFSLKHGKRCFRGLKAEPSDREFPT